MPLLSTRGAASARGFGLLGRVKALADPFFNYVTMLLHGDGTNGAQNNTFLDSSTNNFTITRTGNTTQGSFSPYGPNWSNFFDGAGDYLRLSAAVNLSGDFTAEAFVYSDPTFTGQNQIFGSDLGTADGNKQLYIAPSTYRLTIYDGSSAHASSGAVPQNQWSHVAISRQGSTVTFYINGVSSGTATVSATMSFRIVGGLVTGSGLNEQFKGYISNARIVSGTALYTANFTPSTTPLTAVSGTSLLTCADNRFIDDSANNFAITVFGNPSVQRFSPFQPTAAYSTATIGGSGYFDGAGDWLEAPANTALDLGSGDWTAECWYYPVEAGGELIGINESSAPNNYAQLRLQAQTSTFFVLTSTTGNSWVNTGGFGSYTLRAWNHIAVTRSGNTLFIYCNGIQSTCYTVSGALFNFNSSSVFGRTKDASSQVTGYTANVRIVKGTAVYTSAFTPPTAPLTAITNTSLLCNFTNGAIFDNAMMNDLETVGNAQISTSVVKYGTGSMAFDGSGDALIGQNTPNITLSGNFTIEAWVYQTNAGQNSPQISLGDAANSGTYILYIDTTQKLANFINGFNSVGSGTAAINTWHHVAMVRSGSTITTYLNGVSQNTVTASTTFSGVPYFGAALFSGTFFYGAGYMDELRITNGVARYTANFTPPPAAFPNF